MSKPRRDHKTTHSSADAAETRDRLLHSAKVLFGRKGLDGTTVKDLADHAAVNVSLISYYFQGKEGLYRACIERFGENRLAMAERLLQPPRSREELHLRLRMFFQEMLQLMATEADETRIIMREIDNGLPVAEDIFEKTFLKNFLKLVEFIENARTARLLRTDIDPRITAIMLHSCMVQFARNEAIGKRFFKMSLEDPALRDQLADHYIAIFMEGLEPRNDSHSTTRSL